MQNELFPVEIRFSKIFAKKLKGYVKKHLHLKEDLQKIIAELQKHETPGDRVEGTSNLSVYKVRLKSSDNNRGKSGGYRIYYLVDDPDTIKQQNIAVMLIIFAKSEQADVPITEIRNIIDEYRDQVSEGTE